ncbi:MAG: hypothetical protein OCU12_04665 [Methanophagales archaeon]|nr:hypothetical protein [Methanophagales archaeon]
MREKVRLLAKLADESKIPSLLFNAARERNVYKFLTDDETKMREHYEEIRALPGFAEHVTAVQNDSVFIMSNAFAFAPHYPAPLAVMAKWLYPKRFADFKPEAIHQEYIDEFLGIDFDVYEQGVFVFPRR